MVAPDPPRSLRWAQQLWRPLAPLFFAAVGVMTVAFWYLLGAEYCRDAGVLSRTYMGQRLVGGQLVDVYEKKLSAHSMALERLGVPRRCSFTFTEAHFLLLGSHEVRLDGFLGHIQLTGWLRLLSSPHAGRRRFPSRWLSSACQWRWRCVC